MESPNPLHAVFGETTFFSCHPVPPFVSAEEDDAASLTLNFIQKFVLEHCGDPDFQHHFWHLTEPPKFVVISFDLTFLSARVREKFIKRDFNFFCYGFIYRRRITIDKRRTAILY
jgi:hypothetical protein